jgi:ATP-dependent DNA ligase
MSRGSIPAIAFDLLYLNGKDLRILPLIDRQRDNILDKHTGSDPSVTDYVLEVPARCLQCGAEIKEKTLVEWNEHD